MAILNFKLSVDTDTGTCTVVPFEEPVKKPSKKHEVVEESTEPELLLQEGKYSFNKAAISLMQLRQGDRIVIAYEKDGRPVIGKQEFFGVGNGNKLSSANTVIYKGKDRSNLEKFGTKFQVEPKDNGIFYLVNDKTAAIGDVKLDDDLQVPAKGGMVNVPSFDLDDLLNDILLQDESNYTMKGLDFSF